MWLVVGLGNPGRRYERTRHNVGFAVVERLGDRWRVQVGARSQLGALVGDGTVAGERCVFARPQGFMNRSGHPVVSLAGFYKIPLERILVVHDDLDLAFGTVRCKVGGGHGGHNGLRDIFGHMGREFLRVRVGIGRPPEGWDSADYVLGKWSGDESNALDGVLDAACEAVEDVLREGVESTMNRTNVRRGREGSGTAGPGSSPRGGGGGGSSLAAPVGL